MDLPGLMGWSDMGSLELLFIYTVFDQSFFVYVSVNTMNKLLRS